MGVDRPPPPPAPARRPPMRRHCRCCQPARPAPRDAAAPRGEAAAPRNRCQGRRRAGRGWVRPIGSRRESARHLAPSALLRIRSAHRRRTGTGAGHSRPPSCGWGDQTVHPARRVKRTRHSLRPAADRCRAAADGRRDDRDGGGGRRRPRPQLPRRPARRPQRRSGRKGRTGPRRRRRRSPAWSRISPPGRGSPAASPGAEVSTCSSRSSSEPSIAGLSPWLSPSSDDGWAKRLAVSACGCLPSSRRPRRRRRDRR